MIRLVVLLGIAQAAHAAPAKKDDPRQAAVKLGGAALASSQALSLVRSLTDHVGPRLAGSAGADRAVEWAVKTMKSLGLKNVHTEAVKVPHWVRGEAEARLLAPVERTLAVVALGGSVATPEGGVTAEVIEASSVDELKALGEKVRGKIVLWNRPMRRSLRGDGYGDAVGLRGRGAIEAARLGAVASLLRSVGTGAYRLPHTGATRYDDAVPKIAFGALSLEDADHLHRLLAEGETVRVRLRIASRVEPDVESANVVGELPGREAPDEIVLLGAHLDSWDLGAGAIDDGAGCGIVLETARLIAALGLAPRRTVRVVLYMNEEFGLSGARAYAERHKDELGKHVVALEADLGAGRPIGLEVAGKEDAIAIVRKLAAPLAGFVPSDIRSSEMGGADLIPLQFAGVPVVGVEQDATHYFDWHHTAADTLDKIDPADYALEVAAFATLAHAFAASGDRLPAPLPPPKW